MVEVSKEEMKKSHEELYENKNKEWKKINKRVQECQVEIEFIFLKNPN